MLCRYIAGILKLMRMKEFDAERITDIDLSIDIFQPLCILNYGC